MSNSIVKAGMGDPMSSSTGARIDLGDPTFKAPGVLYPPNFGSRAGTSLFAGTSVGRVDTAIVINQRITGQVEDRVAPR
jgi:hypothetical protein